MADQASILRHVNFGYGKAAQFLGAPFQRYRPTDPLNPLGTSLGSLMADFDVDPKFSYKAPSTYGKPLYYGLFDATNVLVGDYLVGAEGTFFVANMEPNKPVLCVSCNRTVGFFRPQSSPVGPGYYGGDRRGGGEQALMTGVPVSELQGIRGERGPANLPGDTRMPWTSVLMPAIGNVEIEAADRMNDDLGRWFTVSSAELTNLGWRLTAILADT